MRFSNKNTYLIKMAAYPGALLILILIANPPLRAWEEDFHYGLTKWLAVKAGFCPAQTEAVAGYAIAPDDDPKRSAIELTTLQIIPLGDIDASKVVRRWHFPSDIDVPADPSARYVSSRSVTARSEFSQVSNASSQSALQTFGEGLHPFEDSWSHEGVPGTIGIRNEIFWGHPVLRGGPLQHDSDLTPLYSYSAMLAASQVYAAMLTFLHIHPVYSCGHPEIWDNIQGEVAAFVRADTKAKKRQWFNSSGVTFSRKGFLDYISLPER